MSSGNRSGGASVCNRGVRGEERCKAMFGMRRFRLPNTGARTAIQQILCRDAESESVSGGLPKQHSIYIKDKKWWRDLRILQIPHLFYLPYYEGLLHHITTAE